MLKRLISLVSAALVFVMLGLATAAREESKPAQFSDWSEPISLGAVLNTPSTDGCSSVSSDGLSLYFASNRPGGFGGLDVYVSQRPAIDVPWGTPQNVVGVNSAANDLCPTPTVDGRQLLVVSDRSGGCGGQDLYVATRPDGGDDLSWELPQNLGCIVNSPQNDFAPSLFVERVARTTLLYFSSNRPGGAGGVDIYSSALQRNGSFNEPTPVYELNTPFNDERPAVGSDGLEMFFDSDRVGSIGSTDLWTSTRRSTFDPWSEPRNLGAVVNSVATEGRPALSFSGLTLYFMSSRPGSIPSATGPLSIDLYVTTRKKLTRSEDDDDDSR